MATFYSNRPIVTDGLVLYHDFGNPKCYSGTGTTCYDLSGNNHNGAISGSYTGSGGPEGGFVTESLGGLYTPNTRPGGVGVLTTNPYISFDLPASLDFQPSTDDVTLIVWCKPNDFAPHSSAGYNQASWMVFGRGNFSDGTIGIQFKSYNTGSAQVQGGVRFAFGEFASGTATNYITTGSLYQLAYTYTRINGVTGSAYINGELYGTRTDAALQQATGSSWVGTPESPSTGRWMLAGPYAMGGNQASGSITVYNCSLYNKALSADEIKQNYNALRGRYGI